MVAPLRIASANSALGSTPCPSSSAGARRALLSLDGGFLGGDGFFGGGAALAAASVAGCSAAVVALVMAVWSAITRITTFDVGVTPAVGQSGDPHRQARTSLPVGDRAGGIGTPLTGAARIIGTQPVDHRGDAFVQTAAAGASSCPNTDTVSVSSSHAPMMKSRPRTAVSVRRCASGSNRATCASTATRSFSSERRSHLTARSAIAASMSAQACLALHQPGGPGDRRDQPGTQRALAEQRRDLGQMLAQRLGDAHLPRGAPRPDRHRRTHLSSRARPRIKHPQRPLVVVLDTAAGQLRDRGQPARTGDRLLAHPVLDRGHQLHITGRRELRIEHTFESTTGL